MFKRKKKKKENQLDKKNVNNNAEKIKIIIACGTSVATSAIVESFLREKLEDNEIRNFEIYRKRIYDLPVEIEQIQPDIVLTTSPVDPSIVKDVLYYPAMSFLTGGEERDKIVNSVIKYIKTRGES